MCALEYSSGISLAKSSLIWRLHSWATGSIRSLVMTSFFFSRKESKHYHKRHATCFLRAKVEQLPAVV